MESNYVHCKRWAEITYPSTNFNGANVAVWKWIRNCNPPFIGGGGGGGVEGRGWWWRVAVIRFSMVSEHWLSFKCVLFKGLKYGAFVLVPSKYEYKSNDLKDISEKKNCPEPKKFTRELQKPQFLGLSQYKTSSYQYRVPHVKDKTVSRSSYLKHGNPRTRKGDLYIEVGPWSLPLWADVISSLKCECQGMALFSKVVFYTLN